jgi:hypothetical protein
LQRRFEQFPEYGEAQRAVVYQRLERMDHELIPDITAWSRSTSAAF